MATSLDTYSDFEDEDADPLTESFNRASERVKSLVSDLPPPKLLEIYSYYKQAVQGPCDTPRPRWYEMQAKAKWDAWNALGSMTKDQAKEQYIKIISELDSSFKAVGDRPQENWITVSTFARSEDLLLHSDKTVFDFVKDGDLDSLKSCLGEVQVNEVDEDGMGLVHWASDRGNATVLQCLLELRPDVNLQDKEGQTPLHYAASCDHLECVRLLLEAGANPGLKDADGMLAKDVASGAQVLSLLP